MAVNDEDLFEQAAALVTQKESIIFKKFKSNAQSNESKSDKDFINNIEKINNQEDDDMLSFNSHLPNFKNIPIRHRKHRNIEIIQENTKLNLLNTTLAQKMNAIKDRLDTLKLRYSDKLQYMGRLVSDQVDKNFKYTDQLYFDSKDLPLTKQIKFNTKRDLIYPGKFIGIQLDNTDINCLECDEILKLQQEYAENDQIELKAGNLKVDDAIRIVIAGGPFSFRDSNCYIPLIKLIERIQKHQLHCDILILLGPLIDKNNQSLDKEIEEQYYELLRMLDECLGNIQILIVNSTDEILDYQPIPQCPFQINQILQTLPKDDNQKKQKQQTNIDRIKQLGNPVRFIVDDQLDIGILNADILMDLRNLSNKDRFQIKEQLGILLKEFLEQETYTPVCPCSYPIDWSQINNNLTIDGSSQFPNIIIMKSNWNPFIKQEYNTLFINPKSLIDKNPQYCVITYHGNQGCVLPCLRVDFELLK